MSIGKAIKYYRKKKGLTQKELAKLTGLAEITIRQYESEKYEPKRENLYKIRKVLDVNLNQLLGTLPDQPSQDDYDKYDDGTYIPKDIPLDNRTLELLKVIDTINKENELSENTQKELDTIYDTFGMFPKEVSELSKEVEEKAEEYFLTLLYSVGFTVTKADNDTYQVLSDRYRWFFTISKNELGRLEKSIMDFALYTTEKFFENCYDDYLKKISKDTKHD